jgi:hypothetical protein
MCWPTQNSALQPYQSMAMVFRYRQSQDNDACQGGEAKYAQEFFFLPLCHPPALKCLESIGLCPSVRFAQRIERLGLELVHDR